MPRPTPAADPATPTTPPPSRPASPTTPPHWLAIVALLILGLIVAGLVSYLGSTALTV